MWRQPKAVWAVAFASVVAFMGIGLVDPILKPIADNLNASPSEVSLLFTSYMAVMGVAMLVTGVVASRIGPKRTLLLDLLIIIAGAGLAGMSDTVLGIVGWRALWGLGNALFIATALATIVSSARGSWPRRSSSMRRHLALASRSARWSEASSARSRGGDRSSGCRR
jgi:MFS family permease